MRGKFISNFEKIFTAFSFYRLRGSDLNFFKYFFPSILTVLLLLLYTWLSNCCFVIDLEKSVSSANTLMGVLVGFYIAALAAVTSFPHDKLDNYMSGDAPTIKERRGGAEEKITRRRFLSILLGYCAFLSIFVYVVGSGSTAISSKTDGSSMILYIFKIIFWAGYTWFLSSLLIVTMLCLHYLIERMHRD